MGGHWKFVEEYEQLHGTQKQQALAQVAKASAVDGPWKLVREIATFDAQDGCFVRRTLVLDNSVRSTRSEADWLKDREFERTNIVWTIVRYE